MKRYLKVVLTALLALTLVACGGGNKAADDKPATDGNKLLLGVNLDLTGAGAQYGEAEKKGIELAIKLYNEKGGFNGQKVEYEILDSKSNTEEAYVVQTKLAEKGAFAIVGATISGTSAQAVKASGESKVPTVSPSATTDSVTNDGKAGYPFGYRVCYSDMFQAVTMANFTFDTKGFKKVGIIADNSSDYAKGLSTIYKEQFESKGGTIVFEEFYQGGESDFSSIITKVKGNSDVEALFIPGYYGEIGPLLGQAYEQGLRLPVMGVDGYDSGEFINLAGADALNNVFYSNHYSSLINSAEHTAFVDAYKKEYNAEPAGFQALAFDATNLVLDALERAGEANPIKVDEAIRNTKDFKGVTGTITIDELHNAKKSTYVVELKNGVETDATIVNPN